MPNQLSGVKFFENINPLYLDQRGHFQEVFKTSKFRLEGLPPFKQFNVSFSKKNVIRGLHYQEGGNAQGKFVQVLSGQIVDVAVDIDPESENYRTVNKFNLRPGMGLYIPSHFAHGFWATQESMILYGVTEEYNPSAEVGINPMDYKLSLPWLEQSNSYIISDKDKKLPLTKDSAS